MSRHPEERHARADGSHTPVHRPSTALQTILVPLTLAQFICRVARRIVDPLPPDPGRPFKLVDATRSAAAGLIVLVTAIPPADTNPALKAALLAIAAVLLAEFTPSRGPAGSSPAGTMPYGRSDDLALLCAEGNGKGVGR